jgi:hypothetical protein
MAGWHSSHKAGGGVMYNQRRRSVWRYGMGAGPTCQEERRGQWAGVGNEAQLRSGLAWRSRVERREEDGWAGFGCLPAGLRSDLRKELDQAGKGKGKEPLGRK